jgi:hypothetical protein
MAKAGFQGKRLAQMNRAVLFVTLDDGRGRAVVGYVSAIRNHLVVVNDSKSPSVYLFNPANCDVMLAGSTPFSQVRFIGRGFLEVAPD